jgi:hypothetical protein
MVRAVHLKFGQSSTMSMGRHQTSLWARMILVLSWMQRRQDLWPTSWMLHIHACFPLVQLSMFLTTWPIGLLLCSSMPPMPVRWHLTLTLSRRASWTSTQLSVCVPSLQLYHHEVHDMCNMRRRCNVVLLVVFSTTAMSMLVQARLHVRCPEPPLML